MKDPRRYKVPYAAPAETAKAQKQPIAIALRVNGEGAREDEKSSIAPGDSALDIFCNLYHRPEIQLTRDGISGVNRSHGFDGHSSGFLSGVFWFIWQGTERTDSGPIMMCSATSGKL